MKKPLISVILPIRNNQDYIKDCVQSLKKQTFRKFEVIAIDDASSDESWNVLKKAKGKDKRFRLYKNKARYGLRISLIRAVKKARTHYIAFMDPSSINYQRRLEDQIRFFENNPEIAAVGTQVKYIDYKSRLLNRSNLPTDGAEIVKNLLSKEAIEPSTLIINKTLLPKDIFSLENAKPEFVYIDLLLRISRYGKIANLEKSLVYVRRFNNKSRLEDELGRYIEHFKLFAKSLETAGHKPTLKAFLSPILPEI